jgi:hypothetical protein
MCYSIGDNYFPLQVSYHQISNMQNKINWEKNYCEVKRHFFFCLSSIKNNDFSAYCVFPTENNEVARFFNYPS